ncbi:NAD(P)H-quinone oxidoreductase subunit M [Hibiscus syriacus]|uniref:NAD(P)H-quinone oxidoreductase subunit M, chloroplastic n=1 Tax=Hibiscus syriacus TaxID=106335 RepID=A0A6A3C4R6_HIBSY|nr:NAD(P)H-quinone oxidoreductase subunit M, chloroplastic [Hibiscus syriacus]KAE8724185.1 NAD(P)H-quinone oxidoreductase subunit M [Hibiscus syriacus]
MAATSSYIACTKFSMLGWSGMKKDLRGKKVLSISAQQQAEVGETQEAKVQEEPDRVKQQATQPRPVEKQINVKSKNMSKEFGGQWLSSVTRHVRIYAAYIDPETCEFDQTQMDKLTLILDPTDEFVWTPETCNSVYSYFQELVDHYEGAPLTEYTLRLIGSDIEHYIRKLLYDGEIKYNMNAKVLNFSMGKPRIEFNSNNDGKVQDA